jgi:hypothetical protein
MVEVTYMLKVSLEIIWMIVLGSRPFLRGSMMGVVVTHAYGTSRSQGLDVKVKRETEVSIRPFSL